MAIKLPDTYKKQLENLAGLFDKETAKNIVTKAYQSMLEVNEAVIEVRDAEFGGFKFHITDSERVNMQAELTDHYVDTNRPVQDHIVWKPIEITLKGKVGEYVHLISEDKQRSLAYYKGMSLVTSFIPKIPGVSVFRKVRQQISKFTSGNEIINRLVNTATSWTYGIGRDLLNTAWHKVIEEMHIQPKEIADKSAKIDNKQTEFFKNMVTLWQAGKPITVVTSWNIYNNMIVTSVVPMREDSADITEFTITFKQLNTVSSLVTKNEKNQKQPTKGQLSTPVNDGRWRGDMTETEFIKTLPIITKPKGA